MTEEGPPQLHFDPQSGVVPDEVGPGAFPESAGGGVVTLFIGAEADREWAGRAAIEIARTWGDSGARVFLGDTCLHNPLLHDLLGEPSSPNLADVIQRQVPVENVVRPVVAGSFLFAPGGPTGGEGREIDGDLLWEGLVEGFAEVGATVFFFADADVPGLEHILQASSGVVMLGGAGVVEAPRGAADKVWAVLQPAVVDGTPDVEGSRGPEVFPDEVAVVDEAPPPDDSPVEPAPTDAAAEEAPPREWDAYLDEGENGGTTTAAAHEARSSTVWLRRTLPGAIIILGLLAIWIGLGTYLPAAKAPALPSATDAGEPMAQSPAVEQTTRPEQAPPAAEPLSAAGDGADPPAVGAQALRYSLVLGAYRDAGTANRRAAALSRLRPSLLFAVAPVRVNGSIFHRLLAAAPGLQEARALRDSIASLAPGDDPSRWLVRPTPVAFELAVVSDLEMARVGVAQAQERGINAYILGEDAADGPAYRVFAGAYRGPGETAAMRELLDTAGFADAVLLPRVGRVVR